MRPGEAGENVLADWCALEGAEAGHPCLVLGNGPSRDGRDDWIRSFPGPLIACNTFWDEGIRWPDYVASFDKTPVEDTLKRAPEALLVVPDPRSNPATKKVSEEAWELVPARPIPTYRATPYSSSMHFHAEHGAYMVSAWREGGRLFQENVRVRHGNDWHPLKLAWGNLSGMLAIQLAVVLGCRPIYLLGIDVAGSAREDGTVRLTARCPSRDGNPSWTVPKDATREVEPGAFQPDGWDTHLRFWRDLIGACDGLGHPVRRLSGDGALSWVPVEELASVGFTGWSPRRRKTATSSPRAASS